MRSTSTEETSLFTWIVGGVFALIVFSAIYRTSTPPPSAPPASVAQTAVASKEKVESARTLCKDQIEDRKQKYDKLLKAGRFESAAQAIGDCHNLLNDSALKEMVATAEQRHYFGIVNDQKQTPADRLWALEVLMQHHPEKAKGYEKLHAQLLAQREQAEKVAKRKADAEDAARRKKEGVSIGMSKREVLMSSWGKPRGVNTTVYPGGTREQWVYDGGYLYFRDDVLVSIQTSR
jgi:hypothetical protein